MTVPGGLAGGATPVPIPNTEVKPSKADDTAAARQWESRTLPGYKKKPAGESQQAFLFFTACSSVQMKVEARNPLKRSGWSENESSARVSSWWSSTDYKHEACW